MVDGAMGQMEGESPRMVSTPWFDYEIPLSQAAEVGTRKVITEHATIGLVVTTDGTIGDIAREDYVLAEERIIGELQEINKPFCLLLNTQKPQSEEAQALRLALEEKYQVSCMAVNCLQLATQDIEQILSTVLYEFPAKEFCFTLPDWITSLPDETPLKEEIYQSILQTCQSIAKLRDAGTMIAALSDGAGIDRAEVREINLGEGRVDAQLMVPQSLFFEILRNQSGVAVQSEADLLPLLCEMAQIKREYERLSSALEQVERTGYGIVMPTVGQLRFEPPEIVKQNGRFGVKLRAGAPSIHMIRADIETEISPIVGSEKQSEELVQYLMAEFEDSPEKIWESNIFGKSLSDLVNEGLNNKLYKMPQEARAKLQETLQRIINEGSGGLICIIL